MASRLFIHQILRAEPASLGKVALSSLVTPPGALLLYLVVHRYSREAIRFR